MYTYIYIYTHTYMYTYTYTHMCVYIYIYTHTHTCVYIYISYMASIARAAAAPAEACVRAWYIVLFVFVRLMVVFVTCSPVMKQQLSVSACLAWGDLVFKPLLKTSAEHAEPSETRWHNCGTPATAWWLGAPRACLPQSPSPSYYYYYHYHIFTNTIIMITMIIVCITKIIILLLVVSFSSFGPRPPDAHERSKPKRRPASERLSGLFLNMYSCMRLYVSLCVYTCFSLGCVFYCCWIWLSCVMCLNVLLILLCSCSY